MWPPTSSFWYLFLSYGCSFACVKAGSQDCESRGILARDSFDVTAAGLPDTRQWINSSGVLVRGTCAKNGTVARNAALFGATADSERKMIFYSLPVTSVTSVLFDVIACPRVSPISDVIRGSLTYSIDGVPFQGGLNFTVTSWGNRVVYDISSQRINSSGNVSFQIQQTSPFAGQGSATWALDNFIIYGQHPRLLTEDFNPTNECNWFTLIGARTLVQNGSRSALWFNEKTFDVSARRVASTVPLYLSDSHLVATISYMTLNITILAYDFIISLRSYEFGTSKTYPWDSISGAVVVDNYPCKAYGNSYQAFFNQDDTRYINTLRMDLRNARLLTFWFVLGGSGCEDAEEGESVVVEYSPISGGDAWTLLYTLEYDAYRTPTLVSIDIPSGAWTRQTALRWRQLSNTGEQFDTWALNHVIITGVVDVKSSSSQAISFPAEFNSLTTFGGSSQWASISGGVVTDRADCRAIGTYQAFFNGSGPRFIETRPLDLVNAKVLNFWIIIGGNGCDPAESGESVIVEYALSGSSVFTPFYNLSYDFYKIPKLVEIVLPVDVCQNGTTLRWRQLGNSGSSYDTWALNYITFEAASSLHAANNAFFPTDFTALTPLGGESKWASITGGSITAYTYNRYSIGGCKAYGSYQAYFGDYGHRSIETQYLDLKNVESLLFWFVMGGSGCDHTFGPSVVVEYSPSIGSPFTVMFTLSYGNYKTPTRVTILLPKGARTSTCAIRWRQVSQSSSDQDTWALNHIIFVPFSAAGSIAREHVVEFDLYMRSDAVARESFGIRVDYSVDLGRTWSAVLPPCYSWNSTACHQQLASSVLDSALFFTWRRLSLQLPVPVKSSRTQFRWQQTITSSNTSWAIGNVYIGFRCPHNCNGHGRCVRNQNAEVGQDTATCDGSRSDGAPCAFPFIYRNATHNSCLGPPNRRWCATTRDYDSDRQWGYCECGVCQCDVGYSGTACEVAATSPATSIKETFDDGDVLSAAKWSWFGGGVISTDCGVASSGRAAVFNFGRSRLLETTDLNLTAQTTLQFTFQSGGVGCRELNSSQNAVTVEYSTDGGDTWTRFVLLPIGATVPSRVIVSSLPDPARTSSTRIRWYQASALGSDRSIWSIDDVIIDSSVIVDLPLFDSFDSIDGRLWRFRSIGRIESFCNSPSTVLHFESILPAWRRFVSTSPLLVTQATYIQFDVVVGCSKAPPLTSSYVELQYTRGPGTAWATVDVGCSPASSCGNARRASVYRSNFGGNWTRATIFVSQSELSRYGGKGIAVQLRWIWNWFGPYSLHSLYDWAIDNVYIGEGCPSMCSGHGYCNVAGSGCTCDVGFSGAQCNVTNIRRPNEIKERFNATPSSDVIFSLLGGRISSRCDDVNSSAANVLLFDREGDRELITVDMDATNARYIRFNRLPAPYVRNGGVCATPTFSPTIQYSTDSGLTWIDISGSSNHFLGRSVLAENATVPAPARTPSTRFRFWQFDYDLNSSPLPVWAINNLYIGSSLLNAYNPCDIELLCLNGGTCISGSAVTDDFTCVCPPLWTGSLCETAFDPCASNPCENGASCRRGEGASYECHCTRGYTGSRCETEIDYCLVVAPCGNGSTCVPLVGDYRCECTVGRTGKNCTETVDACRSFPCQNAATCESHLDSFVCLCAKGFTGLYCESSISPCVEEPCLNGGTCRDREGMVSCDCAHGFIGSNCSVLCPCRNGTCLAVSESPATAFSCSCFFGFTGQLCDVDIDDCQSGPCTNGGSCVDARGYYRCDCSVGYKGINCETNIDDCGESPCVNGGTCVDGVDSYSCLCAETYTGANCSASIGGCDSPPCSINTTCPAGFTGTGCSVNVDDCESKPCQNGGRCIDGVDSFSCDCALTGFTGNACETLVSPPCDACYNGVCERGRCTCSADFTGERCDVKLTLCSGNPCRDANAVCRLDSSIPIGYTCECRSGYGGSPCVELSCNDSPCRNGGTCFVDKASFSCRCEEKYSGVYCESVSSSSAGATPTWVWIVVALVIVVVLIIVVVIAVLFSLKRRRKSGVFAVGVSTVSNPIYRGDGVPIVEDVDSLAFGDYSSPDA